MYTHLLFMKLEVRIHRMRETQHHGTRNGGIRRAVKHLPHDLRVIMTRQDESSRSIGIQRCDYVLHAHGRSRSIGDELVFFDVPPEVSHFIYYILKSSAKTGLQVRFLNDETDGNSK